MLTETEYIKFVRQYLEGFRSGQQGNGKEKEQIEEKLKTLKKEVVFQGKQDVAKEIWCLEEILEIQDLYLNCFENLKKESFNASWCELERCEIKINHLEKHFPIDKGNDNFGLAFIKEKVQLLQGLFPYKIFTSPEFIIQEQECSTCGKNISLRNPCGHIIGEIYDGEPCCRVLKKADFIALSMTEKPRNKYTVAFLVDDKTGEKVDQYDYTFLKYLILVIQSPFDEWDYKWTKTRHPHSRFSEIGKNDLCPCESGQKYKKCCLNEDGVLRPHLEFILHKKLNINLPEIIYTN